MAANPELEALPRVGMGALRFGDSPSRVREVLGPPDIVDDPDYVGLVSWFYRAHGLWVQFWNEALEPGAGSDAMPLNAFTSRGEHVTLEGVPLVDLDVGLATATVRKAGLELKGGPIEIDNAGYLQRFSGGFDLMYSSGVVDEFTWKRVKPPGDETWVAPQIRDLLAQAREQRAMPRPGPLVGSWRRLFGRR